MPAAAGPGKALPRRQIGVLSPRILRIPHLALLLEPWGEPVPFDRSGAAGHEFAAIAGWGYKPYARRARREAAKRGLPYLALEDGFLRSIGLGVARVPPWSLVIDDLGIYYDAARPSRLEVLIAEAASEPLDDPETDALIDLVRRHRLSKYNDAPDLDPAELAALREGPPLVIVLDQTAGDASIEGAGAGAETFAQMLDRAISENPEARVIVRVHPDVVAGKRRGFLAERARRRGIALEARPIAWPSLVEAASRVYTVSSLGGLDALLAGVPVTCFALPFYAGWGLTDDRQICERRTARPSLTALVRAAYRRYPRYIDPVHGRVCAATDLARRLASARALDREARRPAIVLGVSAWKRPFVRPFVARDSSAVRFAGATPAALRDCARVGGRLMVWGAREPAWLDAAASEQGLDLTRIEDGFLRSVGLGSNFNPALSLVLDPLGIYYDPNRESGLERLLNETEFTPTLLAEAREFRRQLIAGRLSKYNLKSETRLPRPAIPPGRPVILVPGQVEDDASIQRGAPVIGSNLALLEAVRTAEPDAFILYKPHPDVESGNRVGAVPEAAQRRLADAVLSGWDSLAALELADRIHTMTSLLGFEALMRGKAVALWGLPFYAGLGLTEDRLAWPRQRHWQVAPEDRLDALVAAAFLLYPRYRDPGTDLPIGAFDTIEILARQRQAGAVHESRPRRYLRWARLMAGW